MDEFEAYIVSEICRAHAKEHVIHIADLQNNYYLGSAGTLINIRFLGAILRLADELDNTYERVKYLHKEKYSIRHRIHGLEIEHHSKEIIIHSQPKTKREYVILQLVQKQCQKILDEVKLFLQERDLRFERIILLPNDFKLKTKLSEESPLKVKWDSLFEMLREEKHVQGLETIDKIFSPDHLMNEVFRIQLLTGNHCIKHEYYLINNNNSHRIQENTILELDHTKSTHGLYTTSAKGKLSQICFSPTKDGFLSNDEANIILGEKRESIQHWSKYIDKEIHNFLLTSSNDFDALDLQLQNFPLRWASGGVFPVVKIDDKTYTAFFLRDIPPYGWNIPLGASSDDSELINPKKLILREFLEEFLVLKHKPDPSGINEYRLPEIHESSKRMNPLELIVPKNQAKQFVENHVILRKAYDGLDLKYVSEPVIFTKMQ